MTDDPNAGKGLEPEDELEEGPFGEDELSEGELTEGEELADEEVLESEPAVEPLPGRGAPSRRHAPPARAGAAGPIRTTRQRGLVVDPSLRIRDRASELFVVGTVLVFAAIFVYAMAFGRGGALSPTPSPAPSVAFSFEPGASPVVSPTPQPIQTEFQVVTPAPSPGASPAAS